MTSLPPSKALVRDLEIAIRRLVKRTTVMNLALNLGMPLNGVAFLVAPVEEIATQVLALIAQAEADGIDMTALHVEVTQAMSDGLADAFADALSGETVASMTVIPDDISSLLDEGGPR